HRAVMTPTQQDQVGEVGRPAVEPVDDVVGVDVLALMTARKDAAAVTNEQGGPLFGSGRATRSPDVEDISAVLGDAEHRGSAQQAPPGLLGEVGPVVEVGGTGTRVVMHQHQMAL